MKHRIVVIVLSAVALAAGGLAIYFVFHPFLYDTQYFEKIGVNSFLYEDIVKDKGEPDHTEIDGEERIAYYDGLALVFKKGTYDDVLLRAEITGAQYRFGFWSVGTGTDRKKVESVYKNVQKIIDLPEDEFGAIEDGVWVEFIFNSSNRVEKILIYYGP